MRFKATLTPTSGPGSTISLGDTEIKGVQSVEISAAVHDITTVKIAVIGIDAIVEGDAGEWGAAVADAAHHHVGGDVVELAGALGPAFGCQPRVLHRDGLDLSGAVESMRTGEEVQVNASGPALRLAP